jgi:ABC-type Zn uptake system ZnuABC Zn-binding protein ZnuA
MYNLNILHLFIYLEEMDKQNNKYMENRYKTLNKKLDKLKRQHTQEISGIDQKTRKKIEIKSYQE